MMSGSEWWRAIVGAMVGLLYGSLLAFLSSFLFGRGYGTSIPLLVSSAPFSAFALIGKLVGEPNVGYGYKAALLGVPVLWAALGSQVSLSERRKSRRATQYLALMHYASAVALIARIGDEHPEVLLREGLALWAPAYLSGQVILWACMRPHSESTRAIIGAMIGVLYGSILSLLSVFAAGGGHGTPVPLWLSSAPLNIIFWIADDVVGSHVANQVALLSPALVWAGLGSLVALSGRGKRLRLARLLVLLQYASGLALVAIMLPDAWNVGFPHGWDFVVMVVVWVALYLLGQVAVWWRLSGRNRL